MRRHRVLRNTSSPSICLSCALRLSGLVPPAAASPPLRRFLHGTRRAGQQAAAAGETQYTFDPNSTLSPSEQREKAHRLRLRREAQEREAAARRERERVEQERQIKEFQKREEEERVRRERRKAEEQVRREEDRVRREEERARREEARVRREESDRRREAAREGQARSSNGRGEGRQQGGRPHGIVRSVRFDGPAETATKGDGRRGDDNSRVFSRQRSQSGGGQQASQKRVPSPFDFQDVPQVTRRTSAPAEQRPHIPPPAPTTGRVQRPTFGAAAPQAEEAESIDWDVGASNIKPLHYKTDEEVQAERAAEAERVRQEERDKREAARLAGEQRKREREEKRQRELERAAADAEERRLRAAEQKRGEVEAAEVRKRTEAEQADAEEAQRLKRERERFVAHRGARSSSVPPQMQQQMEGRDAQAQTPRYPPPPMPVGRVYDEHETYGERPESQVRQREMEPPSQPSPPSQPAWDAAGHSQAPRQGVNARPDQSSQFQRYPPAAARPWDAPSRQAMPRAPLEYQGGPAQTPRYPPSQSSSTAGWGESRWEPEGEYRAAPFKTDDYRLSSRQAAESAWQNTWQHLTARKQEQAPASPTQNVNVRPQSARRPAPLDDQSIDRDFEEYKRQRDMRARSPFSDPNVLNAPPPPAETSTRPRHEVICARCQEKGHFARECTQPLQCTKCGRAGHTARFCWQPNATSVPDRASTAERRGGEREPGNVFRRTQAQSPAYQDQNPTQAPSEPGVYRPAKGPWATPEREDTRPRRASAYEAQQEDKQTSEPPVAQFPETAAGEQDPEADTLEERRARRRSRWVENEDADEAPPARAPERRKEGRPGRRRNQDEDEDDEAMAAREERAAKKAARKAQEQADKDRRKAARAAGERAGGGTQVHLLEFVSVSNLAQQLGIGYEPFVQRLEQLGYDDVFPGKVLNREISGMIAMEYDFDPVYESEGAAKSEEEERDLKAAPEVEDTMFLPIRPPVVTIMGHVDHGKTTILDYLRRTSVAAGEAGGITQHIGAFSVPLAASGRTITFLDTPGHAAFMSMRQRGANVTDIVILVVAADDSVKPQTLESIRCAREAGVPMIVAVNKVDKPEADVQQVKNDLARHGVEIEDFGGEVQVVEVSGKTGQGLDILEENVVTLSEVLDHRADTEGAVEGWVIEATTKRAGRVATVLVKRGTLRPGAILVAGKTWTRVRSLRDERDQSLMEVGPGMPVEVDGWRDQPVAGDQVLQAPGEQKATDVVAYRHEKGEREKMEEDMAAINESRRLEQEKRRATEKAAKSAAAAAATTGTDADDSKAAATAASTTSSDTTPDDREEDLTQQTLPFIIKADVSGSAEAVAAYIPSLTSPLIAPSILSSSVGAINESDVELAAAAGAHIVAFNLPRNEEMRGLAESKGVKVLENDIIYRVLEDVKAVLEARLPDVVRVRVVGEAEVGVCFEIGVGRRKRVKVAGCKVRNGVVGKGGRVKVLRGGVGGERVYDGTIASLKNVKKDVQEMRKGTECGMGFDGWEDFREGDLVQAYEEVREKRKL